MRLAVHLPEKNSGNDNQDMDPRETASAEVIDLASRMAYPAVAQRKGKSDTLGLAAGVAIVALLGAVTLWSLDTGRQAGLQQAQPQTVPATPPTPVEVPVAEPEPEKPATIAAPRPDPAPQPVLAQAPAANLAPATNPQASPTIVFDASALPLPVAPTTTGSTDTGSSAQDFASRIGGVGGGPARATKMSNPTTTVTQGTLIPAILETAIDTDVPGFVRAVVSQDVRSFDGTRVLVPRSSRLIGQYQSGLQAGQKRAYVIWTRLIRPDGVSVDIASPGTDFSGMAGLPGDVNTHFFKRFGSAMLLSVIDGLTTALSGGASIILGGGQSAAAAAVAEDSKIGPTIRVRQGEPIRVFTARDLDFSRVSAQ